MIYEENNDSRVIIEIVLEVVIVIKYIFLLS